jgi:hypothetical protein
MSDANEPLVWTAKGNLPASRLVETCEWEVGPGHVVCKPTWYLDGEVVRQDCHVLKPQGEAAVPEQAQV